MKTVLLAGGGTGGHLMPAIAIAEAARALRPEWRFVFAGAERGIEATILPDRHLPHHLMPLQPLHRRQWWKNVQWPLRLPALMRHIDALLASELPAVVVGTGGYVSGPVVWRAARGGVTTAILELDVRPGLATRMLAPQATEIWLATPEGAKGFGAKDRTRTVVTGAPIVPPDPSRRAAARVRFGLTDDRPVLVITGGSQGSLAINRLVAEWLKTGTMPNAHVIWATGRGTHAEFAWLNEAPTVSVLSFLDPMADAWAVADLCVARAGMMTLAELCAWGIPSILIPLPTAAGNHQAHNAKALDDAGAAQLLPQPGLDAATLGRTITALLSETTRRAQMASAARARGKPDAANDIAVRVVALAELSS